MRTSTTPNGRMSRRRFIRVCAAAAAGVALPVSAIEAAPALHRWKGIALGAAAEISLLHNDRDEAQELFRAVEAEIRRLEAVFSLYRTDSELVRLNRNGYLTAPSHEMVELLSLSQRLHEATRGAFDPTVQPIWAYFASTAAAGRTVNADDLRIVSKLAGFDQVLVDVQEIRYAKAGAGMTLNGIAQGYITDRVATLLKARGCHDVVVDLGEVSANGNAPDLGMRGKGGWKVTLRPEPALPAVNTEIFLRDEAAASSAKLGTTFDNERTLSHILDPRTGRPVKNSLIAASVVAPTAALADGLSTAAMVCEEDTLTAALALFPRTKAFVVREDGSTAWIDG